MLRAGTSDALILILDDELTPVTAKEFEAARQGPANLIILTQRGATRDRALQELIDLSGRLGWDVHCARELAEAARFLHASSEEENAVSMQAVAVSCALRAGFTAAEPDRDEGFEVLVKGCRLRSQNSDSSETF